MGINSRGDLLERLWEHDKDTTYLAKGDYLASLEGWRIEPHEVDGQLVGITITKGSEFHFVTLGLKWGLRRSDIRQYLEPLIKEFGCVTTRTPKDDSRQQRFNKILGFVPVGEDEFYIHFRLEHLCL